MGVLISIDDIRARRKQMIEASRPEPHDEDPPDNNEHSMCNEWEQLRELQEKKEQ